MGEEQRRSVSGNYPAMNFGNLEIGIHRGINYFQLFFCGEGGHELL
jgi:hypothetical protein